MPGLVPGVVASGSVGLPRLLLPPPLLQEGSGALGGLWALCELGFGG
jgi:hypothetical protein